MLKNVDFKFVPGWNLEHLERPRHQGYCLAGQQSRSSSRYSVLAPLLYRLYQKATPFFTIKLHKRSSCNGKVAIIWWLKLTQGVPEQFHMKITFLEEPPFIIISDPDPVTSKCSMNRGVPCWMNEV